LTGARRAAPRPGTIRYRHGVAREASERGFEVYCNHCGVTFAEETRRCVHCGQRLSRKRLGPGLHAPPSLEELAEEEELPRRSAFSPVTLVWVALLIAGTVYRACTA
jgi:hypothetical protein